MPNNIINQAAKNFNDMPNGVLSTLLIAAAFVIVMIALFVDNPWIKALVLAYIILP